MRILTATLSLITGAGIIWFTSYTQSLTNTPPVFTSFYLLGSLFIAYPVFQATKGYLTKNNEANQQGTNISTKIQRCPQCNTAHYKESNYCHMCGSKL